jgi:hypothetical protein
MNKSIEAGSDLKTCIDFINSIGIQTVFRKIESGSFLPGLLIEKGNLVIDRDAMKYPGDILHEAGHIAVTPGEERPELNHYLIANSKHKEAEEMMAIAWSYAACLYLAIDPFVVFHEDGYKGGGSSIVENFQAGHFFGASMLQWCQMTIEPKRGSTGEHVFPNMIKWMRG